MRLTLNLTLTLTLVLASLGLVVSSFAIVGLGAQEEAVAGPFVEVYKSPT